MELGTALVTVGLGAPTIISIVIGIFKWSLQRNVHHEDAERARLVEEMKTMREKLIPEMKQEFEAELRALRETVLPQMQQRIEAELRTIRERDTERNAQLVTVSGELRGVSSSIGEIRGLVGQLGGQLENTREKQSQAHREAMRELEVSLRQEVTRHAHPELPEKVAKLEASVSALMTRPALKRSRT